MTERGERRARPAPAPRAPDGARDGPTRPILPPLPDGPPRRSRARRVVESSVDPSPSLWSLDELPRRRLNDEERQALRKRRRSAQPEVPEADDGPGSPDPAAGWDGAGRAPAAHAVAANGRSHAVGTAAQAPARRGRDRAGARTVTLGALLLIGLVAITFGAGGIFGSGGTAEPPPTPTPAPTVIAPLAAAPETPTSAASPQASAEPARTEAPGPARWPGDGDGQAVVCLDPGHGGWDLGYTRLSAAGLPAMAEADYNLAHAYDLAERLRARGLVVVMTRRTPNAVNLAGADVNGDGRTMAESDRAAKLDELQARIDVCNEAEADLLVSMHVNGFDAASPTALGYETWYTGDRPFGEQSERFASLVFRALGEEMSAAGYQATAREINDDDRTSIDASDPRLLDHMIMTGPAQRGVARPSSMPGAIIECLFITNDADAAFLATPAGHEAVVAAYEAAIVEYFAEFPG